MVSNTMYPIRQNPYILRDGKGFVKKKEDEESSQSSRAHQEKEEVQLTNYEKSNAQKRLEDSKLAQAQAISSRDANIKNATINISQILKDFRSTAAAIATPENLNEEVNSYLALVEAQVKKDEPNIKLIKSNLKNASMILDGYITETLQRPSKVVENWLDALFLQKINYKYNEEEINPQFLVKFPNEKKLEEKSVEKNNETTEAKPEPQTKKINTEIPQDEQLKKLFIKAKKYSYSKDYDKAMSHFSEALTRAIALQDKETRSKILYEIGKIYDKNDYLTQALTSYNAAISSTQDLNVKTQAHYSMAQIYDDVAQFEPAINHYLSSVSYAGENENMVAQSASLTKIGNIFSDKYQKDAFEFYSEAKLIADETDDSKTKGYVSSSIANAYSKFGEPQKALKYYSDAILEYQNSQSPVKIAMNYKKAADLMMECNNKAKAKSLYEKALSNAKQANNQELVSEINAKLSLI